jgi:PBP1b-binding outer membrane lipoprotein LpoB
MKTIKMIAMIATTLLLAGCVRPGGVQPEQPQPYEKPPARVTSEILVRHEDGVRLLVYIPNAFSEPVIAFDDNVGMWVVAARAVINKPQ